MTTIGDDAVRDPFAEDVLMKLDEALNDVFDTAAVPSGTKPSEPDAAMGAKVMAELAKHRLDLLPVPE